MYSHFRTSLIIYINEPAQPDRDTFLQLVHQKTNEIRKTVKIHTIIPIYQSFKVTERSDHEVKFKQTIFSHKSDFCVPYISKTIKVRN